MKIDLLPEDLKLLTDIINSISIKGSDAETIARLKNKLNAIQEEKKWKLKIT